MRLNALDERRKLPEKLCVNTKTSQKDLKMNGFIYVGFVAFSSLLFFFQDMCLQNNQIFLALIKSERCCQLIYVYSYSFGKIV